MYEGITLLNHKEDNPYLGLFLKPDKVLLTFTSHSEGKTKNLTDQHDLMQDASSS